MHADRNSARPMHAYMKHAMCEHRSMQTGTVQGANTYACGGECEGYVNYGPSPFICQGLRKTIQCICECIPMLEFAPSQVSTCAAVRCSFVVLQFAALRSNAKTQKRFRPTFNMARALGVDRAYTHVARVGIVRFTHRLPP